ncbi:hypothetical protein EC973_002447 [Apophysomyces ossiformis]|uniref:RSE1/DDB1/CPSF1 C-terminal domain-containing protein n=1 Tax=Apophysomyces ossiformis TaxID=679940 RepID=A0A8H7ENM1_9FUNG|nr:hypothetical protein EC973_002447 [Apophysomyces ossiformis]
MIYLCVGLGHVREHQSDRRQGVVSKSGMDGGALILYRLKKNVENNASESYNVRPVWNQDNLHDGVFAICPHSAGLLFSAGSTLYLYQLYPENGRLAEVTKKTLRFLITSIHVVGDRICITSQTESISFYKFNEDARRLEFLKSDTVARSVHHALVLSSRIAIGLCQSGQVIALHDDPDIIIKTKIGSMRTRYILQHDEDKLAAHVLPWTMDVLTDDQRISSTSEAAKPIIGCTVAGGVVTISRVSEVLYTLLLALQERILAYKPTSPLLGSTRDFQAWYIHRTGGHKNAIHGDIIAMYRRLSLPEQEKIVCFQQKAMIDIIEATYSFLQLCLPSPCTDSEQPEEMKSDYELLACLQDKNGSLPARDIARFFRLVVDSLERYC